MNLRERFGAYAPDWELSFNIRIATQTILSKVVRVVQVNNTIDVRVARSVLLPTTHTKPIFLTLITDQRGIGQSQHDTNVGYYDLSAFILVYSQEILQLHYLMLESDKKLGIGFEFTEQLLRSGDRMISIEGFHGFVV